MNYDLLENCNNEFDVVLEAVGSSKSINKAIKKTIQWYLDNRERWENIISGEYQKYYENMYDGRKRLE